MKIISRKEAKQLGLSLYFTGKLCKNGHISQRKTSGGNCLLCQSEWYYCNKEQVLESSARARKRRLEKHNTYNAIWRKNNPDYFRNWRKANKRPRKRAKLSAKQIEINRKLAALKYRTSPRGLAIRLACQVKREAVKLQAIPKWANLKEIQQFYVACPKGMTVDHIVPLQGKNVCGLHVLENLQYLTSKENNSKGNRHKND
jgi:HNH endonuclease.